MLDIVQNVAITLLAIAVILQRYFFNKLESKFWSELLKMSNNDIELANAMNLILEKMYKEGTSGEDGE